MDKLLPIKFFEKRKQDDQITEAGGSKELPKWVKQGDDLTQHSQHLAGKMTEVAEIFESRKQESHELPMILATTITEKALAKSHRSAVVNLLNSDSQSNVIGLDSVLPPSSKVADNDTREDEKENEEPQETRRILSMVTTDELLSNISLALSDTNNNAKLISSIESVEPFKASADGYNPQNNAYRVRLHDYHDLHRNLLAQTLFKNKCNDCGIRIDRETRYSHDMRIYRVSLDSIEDMNTLCGFDGVLSIEEAKPIRSGWDSFDGNDVPSVKQPKEGVEYPVVGVLDSGIRNNAYLSPWILTDNEVYYGDELQDKSHGSMVASVLEYSDEINGTSYSATDGVMMFEAVVIPDLNKEKIYPEDLIDNIRDAIERHKDIKIWNLSVGTDEESELDSFSEYGMALDNIADENDVLIIKSAGNSNAFLHGKEPERIAKMADSVRSLVVGSIAGERGAFDDADVDMPSPFSRKGPGPIYLIKPDLVAYGGNAGVGMDGNLTTTGVKVFDESGKPSEAPGTSFSTPWVTRIAAELYHLLDGEFDPLLIKALMIHNASYPAGERMKMDDKKKFMGFGMPSGTRDILYNSENEITLILRDKLPKGHFIDVLDFPFSKSMVGPDGLFHGQIILTMVSSPILRPSDGPEYCQSDIKVAFGTMERIKERDTTKRTIRNPYGAEDAANVMREDLYKRQFFDVLEDEVFGRERTLLRLGKKYHPIKKYAIDLDEMRDANKSKILAGNRQWYMKVEALFRDAIEREANETGEVLEQDFCILLTIRDPSGKAPVYNEVTQQLQDKNFVYSNVRLKNEVRESVLIKGDNNG